MHPLTHLPLSAPIASGAGTLKSTTWAGDVATGSPGTYTAAAVTFTVPSLTPTVSGARASYTAGVGGDGSVSPADQIAVGITSYLDPASGNQINIPWWAFASSTPGASSPQMDLSLQVQAGDQIYAYVDSNLHGDGADSFYLQDNTTGAYISAGTNNRGYLADGASAHCLVSDPLTLNGSQFPLANFGTVNMQCRVYEEGTPQMGPIGTYLNTPFDMVNNNNDPNATTSDFSPDGLNFAVNWNSSQTG